MPVLGRVAPAAPRPTPGNGLHRGVCRLRDSVRASRSFSSRRRVLTGIAAILVLALVGADSRTVFDRIPLLDPEEFPNGWVSFSAGEDSRLTDTWHIEKTAADGYILISSGEPYGYLRTVEAYGDFEFGLEWRYPTDVNGNSGVLVYTTGDDKIWPTAMQIQLHAPSAGSILPTGGASPKTPVRARDLSRPVNQWNSCLISCRGGRLSVVINGVAAGEIKGCLPDKGRIALQSEGSEIHFRNIWLRRLGGKQARAKP